MTLPYSVRKLWGTLETYASTSHFHLKMALYGYAGFERNSPSNRHQGGLLPSVAFFEHWLLIWGQRRPNAETQSHLHLWQGRSLRALFPGSHERAYVSFGRTPISGRSPGSRHYRRGAKRPMGSTCGVRRPMGRVRESGCHVHGRVTLTSWARPAPLHVLSVAAHQKTRFFDHAPV
jgi:hypothetical protein